MDLGLGCEKSISITRGGLGIHPSFRLLMPRCQEFESPTPWAKQPCSFIITECQDEASSSNNTDDNNNNNEDDDRGRQQREDGQSGRGHASLSLSVSRRHHNIISRKPHESQRLGKLESDLELLLDSRDQVLARSAGPPSLVRRVG